MEREREKGERVIEREIEREVVIVTGIVIERDCCQTEKKTETEKIKKKRITGRKTENITEIRTEKIAILEIIMKTTTKITTLIIQIIIIIRN